MFNEVKIEYNEVIPLTSHEMNLVKFIRTLGYGSVELTVQDGQPIMIKKTIQSVKL
jgi:hypothetical protein